jgi:hypothetical protein
MRVSLGILFLFIFTATHAYEKADSAKAKLKAAVTFSLNSNGISSIPAFSLGDPAAMASVSLAKGRFSYDPTLAYGLDGKPWFIDNWFHFKLVNRPSFELRTGMNISSFFTNYKLPEETVLKGERYFAFELAWIYKFNPGTSLSLSYWSDNGQEKGTLKGHFIDLIADKTDIPLGKQALLAVNLQLFYIDYTDKNDGLFIAPRISAGLRSVPLSLFFQAIQPITSNMTPSPEFQWNIGLAYTL